MESTKLRLLPVGTDDFEKVRTENLYYADKTDLIHALLRRPAEVTVITRPRRFGKSLNMSMLKWFFEIPEEALYRQEETISGNLRAAEFQKSLFAGLSVSSDEKLCDRYMGRYPVISISLKNVDGLDFEQAFNSLCAVIGMETDRFGFLEKSPVLTEDERADYQKIVQRDASGKRRYAMTYDVLCGSLLTLSRLLQKHFGRKVIILVDEYDVPLDKAYLNGFYDEMASLIRTIFNASLKSNPALAFSVMTGCLRISKESIFTGLNNLKVDSITDRQFSEYFGFTEQEVSELLGYYGRNDLHAAVAQWYDGYNFAGKYIYCPWDVIRYCDDAYGGSTLPKNYWVNTSGNDIILKLITSATAKTKEEIELLIAGKAVQKRINEAATYRDLQTDPDNVFTLLFYTGYLTMAGVHRDENDEDWYDLVIPNREIRNLFRTQVMQWFQQTCVKRKGNPEAFLKATLEGNAEEMQKVLNGIMAEAISIRDTDTRDELKENFYHGMLIGLLADCTSFSSNREAGNGYADILIKDLPSRTGVVLELKYVKEYAGLSDGCEQALSQIAAKNYEDYFAQEGMLKVRSYGVAFWKKLCMVKQTEE